MTIEELQCIILDIEEELDRLEEARQSAYSREKETIEEKMGGLVEERMQWRKQLSFHACQAVSNVEKIRT